MCSGGWIVLVGWMVFGVCSLILIFVGVFWMNLVVFSVYIVIGSGFWNILFIGVGVVFGM